jgi:hypothetical protein
MRGHAMEKTAPFLIEVGFCVFCFKGFILKDAMETFLNGWDLLQGCDHL